MTLAEFWGIIPIMKPLDIWYEEREDKEMMNMKSNYVFKGRYVSMKVHDLEDDTYFLIDNATKKPILIGTREQILEEYDTRNGVENG